MKSIIGANWKLNPASLAEAERLVSGYQLPNTNSVEIVIFPPFVFLEELAKKFPRFTWGAQDFFFEDTGAYTGEVSLPMLKDIGASYVLVGHSDRRIKFGETDEVVNKKLLVALEDGFNVILAVGEKEKGNEALVIESLRNSTKNVRADSLGRLNIAYEPVWAISSTPGSKEDTPEHASGMIAKLQEILDVRYLYGGSVNSENAASFLSQSKIHGALIGSISLKAERFSKILEVANHS